MNFLQRTLPMKYPINLILTALLLSLTACATDSTVWTGLYPGPAERTRLSDVYISLDDGSTLPFGDVFEGFQPDNRLFVKRFPVDKIHVSDIFNREIAAVLQAYDANENRVIEEPEFAVFFVLEGARGLGYAARHVEVNGRTEALVLPTADVGGLMNYVDERLPTMEEPARTYLTEVKWIGYDELLKPSDGNGRRKRH